MALRRQWVKTAWPALCSLVESSLVIARDTMVHRRQRPVTNPSDLPHSHWNLVTTSGGGWVTVSLMAEIVFCR